MSNTADTAQVIVRPPLVWVLAVIAGFALNWQGTYMELVPMAEFTIVTRSSFSAWIPELIAAAGPDVTET